MRIHADHQPYRKKPYVARWYEAAPSSAKASDGKLRQRNKFFASAAARDEFIHQLKETAQRQDPVLPTLPPHQLIRWQQAIAIAPEADPVEVFKFWKAEQCTIAKLGDRYLHDAASAYLYPILGRDQKRPREDLAPDSLLRLEPHISPDAATIRPHHFHRCPAPILQSAARRTGLCCE